MLMSIMSKIEIILTGVMGEEFVESASDFKEADSIIGKFFDQQIEEYNLHSFLHGSEYFYHNKWNGEGEDDIVFTCYLLISGGDRLTKRYRECAVHSYREPIAICFLPTR